MKTMRQQRLLVFIALLLCGSLLAQPNPVVITGQVQTVKIKGQLSYLVDKTATITNKNIHTFQQWKTPKDNPVFQVTKGNVWLRLAVKNQTSDSTLFLDVQYSNISHIDLYQQFGNVVLKKQLAGNALSFDKQNRSSANFIFPLIIQPGQAQTFYLKIASQHPVLLPLSIRTKNEVERTENIQTIIIGTYLGIIFAMFFYNLFLFVSTLDKSYLIYILFLLFLGLAQLTISGHTFMFLWPGCPAFNQYAVAVTSAMAGITGIGFSSFFLQIKRYLPKVNLVLKALGVSYVVSLLLSVNGYSNASYFLLNVNGSAGGILLLAASWYIGKKGYKPAYFYLVAWVAFLVGLIIVTLRNFNVLPNNYFTTYILYIGSAIEVILLSIALADKINILRKEHLQSQADALRISQENEKLVKERNISLEAKVMERTEELQSANQQLSEAFSSLKDAQIQLVEAEKMASLGQLTAGIAHEINNPINFVKSNIKPLMLDINDLFTVIDEYAKTEGLSAEELNTALAGVRQLSNDIDMSFVRSEVYSLMKGIEDGADRTAEIVRGLRNFSRLDESQFKKVNIHEGIDSTLIILRNIIPENISVIKEFNADGDIECFPGKLNQVFMNILSNSVQAIKAKDDRSKPESIIIATRDISEDELEISISDTGPGMSPEVKQKIFDPFFTTKEVGEGTGLGLAIVFKIIQEHQGKIEVISQKGEGAKFVITLHRTIPMKNTI